MCFRKILDDNYYHSLVIYEDRATKGWRLHAAVWEGEMSMCPVWTAFSKRTLHFPCLKAGFALSRISSSVNSSSYRTFNTSTHTHGQPK